MRRMILALVVGGLWSVALGAQAGEMQDRLLEIQHQWAHINYEMTDDDKKVDAFDELAAKADQLAQDYPQQAEPLAWKGIILSTEAGAAGGLSALGLVDDARQAFEKSLAINPDAAGGSAHTSLGSLYYQVPGWPISFGDDEKAEQQLKAGLAVDPQSIDGNYFYADYLKEQDQCDKAMTYFQKALDAPARPERPLADKGRRKEIRAKMAECE
ncbi:hypothetical protein QQM79_04235 [Marinobacteraceae bacterium S3BR75-40.1]